MALRGPWLTPVKDAATAGLAATESLFIQNLCNPHWPLRQRKRLHPCKGEPMRKCADLCIVGATEAVPRCVGGRALADAIGAPARQAPARLQTCSPCAHQAPVD